MLERTPSRRSVLKAAGSSVAALGSTNLAGAQPDETVEINVGVSSNRGRQAARKSASEVVRNFDSLAVVTIRVPKRAAENLRRRDDVRYVEPNGTYRALGQTLPWGADRVDADVAHANDFDGGDADIAIIDSGIDDDHPDLRANVASGRAFVTCSGSNCNYDWSDDHERGHGTHCAGVAGAASDDAGTKGVGPNATLHAVKVLDANGDGTWSDVAAGIEHAADQGWDVANLSLGGKAHSRTVADACSYAHRNGVLLVAAAGNSGPCSDCVDYPAASPECIAVSATASDDSLARFSNTGPEVELAAPGEGIYSTVPGGYDEMNGTSMAAPHVSGAATLLASRGLTNDEVRDRLRATAEDVGLSGREQGRGLLDVEAATSVGERGRLTFDQPDAGTWYTERLDREFENAVVVVSPLSYEGPDPSHVRVSGVREVRDASFRYQIEEWDYRDGSHVEETAHYAVFDEGTYTSTSGTDAEVGTVDTDHSFAAVNLSQEFATAPVVLAQTQTRTGREAVVTRIRNVSADGFEVRLQEEEAKGPHRVETVGYVAMTPGVGNLAGTTFEVGRTANAVDDSWHRIDFAEHYDSPHFVADFQTYRGPDTAGLRYRNLTADGVEVKVEEERSADRETAHTTEVVGYAVAEGTGLI